MEPRALSILDKHSATEPYPQPHLLYLFRVLLEVEFQKYYLFWSCCKAVGKDIKKTNVVAEDQLSL